MTPDTERELRALFAAARVGAVSEHRADGLQTALATAGRRRRRRDLATVGGAALAATALVAAVASGVAIRQAAPVLPASRGATVTVTVTPTASGTPASTPQTPSSSVESAALTAAQQSLVDALPTAAEIGPGVTPQQPEVVAALVTVARLQVCDPALVAQAGTEASTHPRVEAGVWLTAYDSNKATSVDVTIHRYAAGGGAVAWTQLKDNAGACVWFENPTVGPWEGNADGLVVAGTVPVFGNSKVGAVQRVGDDIVSTTVTLPDAATARSEAVRLTALVAARLAAGG